MKIARVFPSKTSMTPNDPDAYIGLPGLFTPESEGEETYLYKEREWNLLQRQWTRPAIIKSIMKEII